MKAHFICIILILAILSSPAWAGCGKWVVRYAETDFLEDPIFDEAVASSTGSSATLNPDGSARVNQPENSTQNSTAAGNETAEVVPDLNGRWHLTLNAVNGSRAIDLILIQTGERLQGYGTLEQGASDMPATATGSLSSEAVSLDVRLSQQKKEFRLEMAVVEDDMQGSYGLYIDGDLADSGGVTGRRSS
ncbi:MAG TPA: hypothetical protein PKY93_06040 [Methanothrix sp.]|nr:hypothetical protein [Methanothrix sp.]